MLVGLGLRAARAPTATVLWGGEVKLISSCSNDLRLYPHRTLGY